MDLSTVCFLSFILGTFFLYQFSRHSRLLSRKSWDMEPEELEHYQTLARSALICAGVMMGICLVSLVVLIVLFCVGHS